MTILRYLGHELLAIPRPYQLIAGYYPLRSIQILHAKFVIGISPYGFDFAYGAVDPYLLENSVSYTFNVCNINCGGPPSAPVDKSSVQATTANPITVYTTCWKEPFWFDYVRSSIITGALQTVTKNTNAYAGDGAPVGESTFGYFSFASASGGTAFSTMTNWLLSAPGCLTRAAYDGTKRFGDALVSQPFKVPGFVGRWNFLGETGQVVAGGSSPYAMAEKAGYVVKLKPKNATFTLGTNKVSQSANTEYGMEMRTTCFYSASFYETKSFVRLDPNPPYTACVAEDVYVPSHVHTKSYSVLIDLTILPVGNTYTAVLCLSKCKIEVSGVSSGIATHGMHGTSFSYPISGVTKTDAVDFSATTIGFNTTTTITKALEQISGNIVVTIVVDATGSITTCELAVTPSSSITDSGAGWHDSFSKLS